MSHARLAPSAAKRWMQCPASIAREEGLPDSSSPYARWGTAAHAILERSILNGVHPLDVNIDDIMVEDETGQESLLIHQYGEADIKEMRETAAVAYEHTLMRGDVLAECQVNPGGLVGRDDCWGTADIQILEPDMLEVVDLKAGKGVLVEPDDPQLLLYAVGALRQHFMRYPQDSYASLKVRCTVVQPRAPHSDGPIRSITWMADRLMLWFEDNAVPAMYATDSPVAPANPSESACKWCKARPTCREAAEVSLNAVQAAFQPVANQANSGLADKLTRDPATLGPDELRFILDHEKLITGWLDAVRKHAKTTLERGGTIPGYKLVPGRASRAWDLKDAEALFGELKKLSLQNRKKISRKDFFNEVALSPAQAEKQLKPLVNGATWEKIEAHIVKTSGAPTLAPETDHRPALNASAVFTPVESMPDYMN